MRGEELRQAAKLLEEIADGNDYALSTRARGALKAASNTLEYLLYQTDFVATLDPR